MLVEENFDVSRFTSFKCGGKIKKVIFPESIDRDYLRRLETYTFDLYTQNQISFRQYVYLKRIQYFFSEIIGGLLEVLKDVGDQSTYDEVKNWTRSF